METIKALVDFNSRYDPNGDPLCQAYTDTGDNCTRLGKYVNIDLADLVVRYTGRNIPIDWNCCMFCKQHTKKIAKELALLCIKKLICTGMSSEAVTGVPDEFMIDWEEKYRIFDKLNGIQANDSGKKKKKSPKNKKSPKKKKSTKNKKY